MGRALEDREVVLVPREHREGGGAHWSQEAEKTTPATTIQGFWLKFLWFS